MNGSTRAKRFNDWWGPPLGGRKMQCVAGAFFIIAAVFFAALAVDYFSKGAWVSGLIDAAVALAWGTFGVSMIVRLQRT